VIVELIITVEKHQRHCHLLKIAIHKVDAISKKIARPTAVKISSLTMSGFNTSSLLIENSPQVQSSPGAFLAPIGCFTEFPASIPG